MFHFSFPSTRVHYASFYFVLYGSGSSLIIILFSSIHIFSNCSHVFLTVVAVLIDKEICGEEVLMKDENVREK